MKRRRFSGRYRG